MVLRQVVFAQDLPSDKQGKMAMTGVVEFESEFGPVLFEATDEVLIQLGGAAGGVTPLSGGDDGEHAKADGKFSDAIQSLKSYADNLQKLVQDIDVTPNEVSVEVSLKLVGSAGFVIAKAGAETAMKVNLKWTPKVDK